MAVPHIVLLGDSIFDNGAYTRGEPDVVSHLRELIPDRWQATRLAVDGARIAALGSQLKRLPDTATHLVISIGGNDVLSHIDLLARHVASMIEALDEFAHRADTFAAGYRRAIGDALKLEKRTIVCTVYEGQLERHVQRAARVALSVFNDAILRTAAELRIPVIELRSVCRLPSDYANPIEPSGAGGRKIAMAIRDAVDLTMPLAADPLRL